MTVILKYSLISQKPPSLTWEKITDPAPVAIGLGYPHPELLVLATGATMPEAVVIATVADPVATRISAANSQPITSGDK